MVDDLEKLMGCELLAGIYLGRIEN